MVDDLSQSDQGPEKEEPIGPLGESAPRFTR